MPKPGGSSGNKRVLFLAPEEPTLGGGGGGIRSASLLEYLRRKYEVDVATFALRPHSRSTPAKIWRNAIRVLRHRPPLFDRFSGYEAQIAAQLKAPHYRAAVVEHFWCAAYADLLRPKTERLILDLHNVESALAGSHAHAAPWPASWASKRFAAAYESLERHWLPKFDVVLVASQEDARRIHHPRIVVYPNAIPMVDRPAHVSTTPSILFTGNLEYHPNIEAVRWFRTRVWPALREHAPDLEWRIAGVNPGAVEHVVSGDARIRLLGPVEDAIATLAQAQIAIVPLRSGSGTRFKILEAWAAARPVVSTTIGAEGLGAVPEEHLLIADDPAAFESAILRLLGNSGLRTSLGESGRDLYLRDFTWQGAWKMLENSCVL